jgi:hypothetical protein
VSATCLPEKFKRAASSSSRIMTKTQIRYRLERPLNEELMPRVAAAHAIYGIMRVQVAGQEIIVDYDASRLMTGDVEAALKRVGIPIELEK